MIDIERVCISGWWAAIRGARNALESWGRSDTVFKVDDRPVGIDILGAPIELSGEMDWQAGPFEQLILGKNDRDLMLRLARCGGDEAKYRRYITVSFDITAPLYWWKQADTYRVGVVEVPPSDIEFNSCSTMHKGHAKEFTLDDFSHEDLSDESILITWDNQYYHDSPIDNLIDRIGMLNALRDLYNETKDKKYWRQMIQSLGDNYNQKRTVQLNYQVLAAIYPKRRAHKLQEWRDFCEWIESLPYSETITLNDKKMEDYTYDQEIKIPLS